MNHYILDNDIYITGGTVDDHGYESFLGELNVMEESESESESQVAESNVADIDESQVELKTIIKKNTQ